MTDKELLRTEVYKMQIRTREDRLRDMDMQQEQERRDIMFGRDTTSDEYGQGFGQKAIANALSDSQTLFHQALSSPLGLTASDISGLGGGNNKGAAAFGGFDANADPNSLASLDVATQLPKLSEKQISDIIAKHFSKSTVIKPSDAAGIFNAQQNTGMSALAILGIGALESGYGTSNIAKQKNNIWGWNATNVNPGGNATAFSQMSQGALEFANKYMNTYYNKYGAKSISAAGTGNNPAGKGYAYYDNGSINPTWATSIGSIMKNFYNTAKGSN